MTGIPSVVWRIDPVSPPRPRRHCSACGSARLFHSSGKIRLNANGRRLDAWLIYKCESCDKTWNLPLVERASVSSITESELQSMHISDPAWVREREFDLDALRQHCDEIDMSPNVTVTKIVDKDWPEDWSVIKLAVDAQYYTGLRLNRLLASELKLNRSELQSMQRAGGLHFDSADRRTLKKPVRGSFSLRFIAIGLTEVQRMAISYNLLNR